MLILPNHQHKQCDAKELFHVMYFFSQMSI